MKPAASKTKFTFWFLGTLAVLALATIFLPANPRSTPIPYSRFETLLEQNKIATVQVAQNSVQGTLKKPERDGLRRFQATRVNPGLAAALEKHHVTYYGKAADGSWLITILSWIAPLVLVYGLWILLARRFFSTSGGPGGQLMAIGKSRAKIYMEKDTKVTFAEVAGVDEAKEELKEVVEFLRDPKSYGRLGARIPKGVLLVGPPGTGKTLLARAVAGEAGVKFFSISGSEFVEMFIGVGAARVRDLFEQARKEAPAIVFIDEIDALGGVRMGNVVGTFDEKAQTLNQLLVELDGFDPTTGVVMLAATNRPEILDPALLRAGRFDRQVLVDRPDRKGRIEILTLYLKRTSVAPDVDPGEIAAMTPGFTGADLANLVNEAALLATRRSADRVHLSDFTSAVERMVAGLEKKNRLLIPKEREFVAYHELGHAIVAISLPGQDPIHKISIIPRGMGSLGYTIQRPTADRFMMTQEELEDRMAVLLGGRAAERLFFHHLSTGAADDLAKATEIARSMVLRSGMDDELGHVTYDHARPALGSLPRMPQFPEEPTLSDETDRLIDHAVRDLLGTAYQRALTILRAHQRLHAKTAKLLLEKETLEKHDLDALYREVAPKRSGGHVQDQAGTNGKQMADGPSVG